MTATKPLTIPKRNDQGVYLYPDGSGFRYCPLVGKWYAWWAMGSGNSTWSRGTPTGCCPLRDGDGEKSWFVTAEEAAQCIADGGEGPAAGERSPWDELDEDEKRYVMWFYK